MKKGRLGAAVLCAALAAHAAPALAQKGGAPVTGDGTPGAIPKFAGVTNVGDSVLFENKFGQIGLGTTAPTSRLTVVGKVQSTQGGFVFPDGTLQATAGLAPNQAVTSLNGLRGDVTIKAGKNVVVTPSGNTVVIDLPAVLTAVVHDGTLEGDGTAASPLRVVPQAPTPVSHSENFVGDGSAASPLALAFPFVIEHVTQAPDEPVLTVVNRADVARADAASLFAGLSSTGDGGVGLRAHGGNALAGDGGPALFAIGGVAADEGGVSGEGIVAFGGFGQQGGLDGLAGRFEGDVFVHGSLDASGPTARKIDHPLDPENRYLVHEAVESSESLNVYSGNATTDASGEVVVALPEWFDAINADVRYQLTVVGATFARAVVAEKVRDNRFTIRTDAPNVEVSWQVTGVRADAASKARAFVAEREKPAAERGTYLDPEAFGAPAERGAFRARDAERLRATNRK